MHDHPKPEIGPASPCRLARAPFFRCPLPNPGRRLLAPLAAALLLIPAAAGAASSFELDDTEGNTLSVEVRGSGGDLRVLWPNSLGHGQPGVERTLSLLPAAGIELWLADPLEARFLPRSNDNVRRLSGASVAALIAEAGRRGDMPTVLVAQGRMGLAALRGLHRLQLAGERPRLDGVVLLYPNLFGPTPVAGDAPALDPVVGATNWPLLILQPRRGALRWSIGPVLEQLWANGSAAHALLIADVRDWFLFHEPGEDPAEDAAAARLPSWLRDAQRLMAAASAPAGPLAAQAMQPPAPERITGLQVREQPPAAFELLDTRGVAHALDDYLGGVTLVNFWASWCPPCVEEIPSMNRLGARYAAEDFRIVSINFQESPQTIDAFMQRVDVHFPVLIDADGAVSRDWRVLAFPSSFILDRSGQVRYSVNSAIPWDEPAVLELIDALVAE
jgi:thiol-disulfide isomerase/thioredoxin